MSKRLRIALFGLGGLLLLVAVGLFALYRAAQHVPDFYRRALEVDDAAQEQAAQRMERKALEMTGDLQRPGHWQKVITADEINGWLAVELPRKFPTILPPTMRNPRVAIESDRIVLACEYQGTPRSVLHLTIMPYMTRPDVLALQICKVRAGLVPMPLGNVLESLGKAVKAAELEAMRKQAGDDPVIEITLPTVPGKYRKNVRIKTLQLRDGEIYVEGTTEREP